MANLSISLLGPPRIEQDGSSLIVDTRKGPALMAYLAVTGQSHSRENLAAFLWNGDIAHTKAALRRTLSVLKKALKGEWLLIEKNMIGLRQQEGFWLDVAVYSGRVATYKAHQHAPGELCQQCLPLLQEAVMLYRDSFLSGFLLSDEVEFVHWQDAQTAYFHQQQLEALQSLVHYHAFLGEYHTAVTFAQRWLQLEPTDELGHQWLMKLLAWQGQEKQALSQYQEYIRLLREVLRTTPKAEIALLAQQIQNGHLPEKLVVPDSFAPKLTPSIPPEFSINSPYLDLPLQLTPLVGRQKEVAELGARLNNPYCRLLTITGLGGTGKTRLAIECARQQAQQFRHGVIYLPLSSIHSVDYLLPTLADRMKITLSDRNPQQQLLNYLREKEMLIVLDNFEHLLAAADLLMKILQSAPAVKLLLTSRICLNFQAEWLYEIRGLSVPIECNSSDADYASATLFLFHAQRLDPQFSLSAAETIAVWNICRMLEGLPLGLGLAAASLSKFSPSEIAGGIQQNLDFLQTSMCDVPTAHHTLRAVFEHSWQLLPDAEKELLPRLAIFHGGFNSAAASSVTSATPLLLTNLVDKSLLTENPDGRYEMHTLIQQYSSEKLQAFPQEWEQTRRRQGQYFASFLQSYAEQLNGFQQSLALKKIREDIGNIRAAWQWATLHREEEVLQKMLNSLYLFYNTSCWYEEGEKAFTASVIAFTDPHSSSHTRTSLQLRQASFILSLCRYEEAKDILLSCLTHLSSIDLPLERMFCLYELSKAFYHLGEYKQARIFALEGLVLAKKTPSPLYLAFCCNSLAGIYRVSGKYNVASLHLKRALKLNLEIGNTGGAGIVYGNLGHVFFSLGKYDQAVSFYQKSMTIMRKLENTKSIGSSLLSLGRSYSYLGDNVKAMEYLSQSLLLLKKVGDLGGVIMVLLNLGSIAYKAKNFGDAESYYLEGLKLSQAIYHRQGIIYALNDLGKVALAQNNNRTSATYFHRALTLAVELKATPPILEALSGTIPFFYEYGDWQYALYVWAVIRDHPTLKGEEKDFFHIITKSIIREQATDIEELIPTLHKTPDLLEIAKETLYTMDRLLCDQEHQDFLQSIAE